MSVDTLNLKKHLNPILAKKCGSVNNKGWSEY